jgi:large subunit ribosomal protein L9
VSSADVASAIKAAGGPTLDKRTIDIERHIKSTGKHPVNIRLHPDVTARIQLEVTAR